MEWDQITNSWAAMTNRLRSDRVAGRVYAGASQDFRRASGTDDANPGAGLPPKLPVTVPVTDIGSRSGQ